MRSILFAAVSLCVLAAAPATAQTLDGRQVNNGVLGGSDPRDGNGSFYDDFPIGLAAGQRVRVSATRPEGSNLDPVLEIYSGSTRVAYDDDSGGYPNARAEFTAPSSGTYRIRVRAFSSTSGPYELLVEPINSYGALEPVTNGRFDDSVPRIGGNGSHYRDFRVTLAQGEAVVVRMTSNDIDPYLYIYDAGSEGGTALATNDDSGGTLTSSILFVASRAGTYTIRASELTHRDGAWTLYSYRLPRL